MSRFDLIEIPAEFSVQRSTPFFTRANVPPALLERHNTAEGVFGQICVFTGRIVFHGYADLDAPEPETTRVVRAGAFIVTAPRYWHRVELSIDARFNIHFWSNRARTERTMYSTRQS
ncbi:MAG: DUF1971 domain-containing protein [Proteobacteria bacterium]|nr:DUF1971 domain-containing protein [Pseudomonadota bacterium]